MPEAISDQIHINLYAFIKKTVLFHIADILSSWYNFCTFNM